MTVLKTSWCSPQWHRAKLTCKSVAVVANAEVMAWAVHYFWWCWDRRLPHRGCKMTAGPGKQQRIWEWEWDEETRWSYKSLRDRRRKTLRCWLGCCERRSRGNGCKDWNDRSEVASGNGSNCEKRSVIRKGWRARDKTLKHSREGNWVIISLKNTVGKSVHRESSVFSSKVSYY